MKRVAWRTTAASRGWRILKRRGLRVTQKSCRAGRDVAVRALAHVALLGVRAVADGGHGSRGRQLIFVAADGCHSSVVPSSQRATWEFGVVASLYRRRCSACECRSPQAWTEKASLCKQPCANVRRRVARRRMQTELAFWVCFACARGRERSGPCGCRVQVLNLGGSSREPCRRRTYVSVVGLGITAFREHPLPVVRVTRPAKPRRCGWPPRELKPWFLRSTRAGVRLESLSGVKS